jgi:hypothetical protein
MRTASMTPSSYNGCIAVALFGLFAVLATAILY